MTEINGEQKSTTSEQHALDRMATEESAGSAYRLELPAFEGPLDLLLHLIRKHEIDIYDIPIFLITEQYKRYLEAMEELDLEIAADYIYMAALLINIKSRMLLPRPEKEDEEEEDPRQELVQRLLEYQRFKAVAETFAETDALRMGVWARPTNRMPDMDESAVDMSEVSLYDLIDAFHGAMRRYKLAHPAPIHLDHPVHRVVDKMRELVGQLEEKSPIRLKWFLEGRDRPELVAIFLAMLELVRLGTLTLRQNETFEDVILHRTERPISAEELSAFDEV